MLCACGSPPADPPPNPLTRATADAGRSPQDRERDARDHPVEVLDFLGIGPGMTVLDLNAATGYYTELLALAVGTDGKVISHNHPGAVAQLGAEAISRRYANGRLPNVEPLLVRHADLHFPAATLDAVLMSMVYHDTYWHQPGVDWGPIDRDQMLSRLFDALRPDGIVGVIDHAAVKGADPRVSVMALHRIDPQVVRDDFARAGFVLDSESPLLRNAADDHRLGVFDPAIQGHTDRFVLRFRRAAERAPRLEGAADPQRWLRRLRDSQELRSFLSLAYPAAMAGDSEAQLAIARGLALCNNVEGILNVARITRPTDGLTLPPETLARFTAEEVRCRGVSRRSGIPGFPDTIEAFDPPYWIAMADQAGSPTGAALQAFIDAYTPNRSADRQRLRRAVESQDASALVAVGLTFSMLNGVAVEESEDDAWRPASAAMVAAAGWRLLACSRADCQDPLLLPVPMTALCPRGSASVCSAATAERIEWERQLGSDAFARAEQFAVRLENVLARRAWDEIDWTTGELH